MKSNILKALGGIALVTAVLIPAIASAGTQGDACHAQAGLASGQKATTTAQFQTLGNCQIAYRTADIANAVTRVGQMQKVDAGTKTTLTQNLNTASAGLAGLLNKLQADTTVATAQQDYQALFNNYRIYQLLIPQVRIIATSDRAQTIVGQIQTVQATLITQNASASATVQAENAPLFTDLAAKLSDATTESTDAANNVRALMPDQGVQSVETSNKAAITGAQNLEKVFVTPDLQASVNDVKQIRTNLGV